MCIYMFCYSASRIPSSELIRTVQLCFNHIQSGVVLFRQQIQPELPIRHTCIDRILRQWPPCRTRKRDRDFGQRHHGFDVYERDSAQVEWVRSGAERCNAAAEHDWTGVVVFGVAQEFAILVVDEEARVTDCLDRTGGGIGETESAGVPAAPVQRRDGVGSGVLLSC